jgi:hypothetical protein
LQIITVAYPEQQLPGAPQELGEPQHPPFVGPSNCWDKPAVLCADINFVSLSLSQELQRSFSSSLKTINSLTAPHFSHLYS